ncbi:hypothetical protein [Dictyobacter arantiisoli]|uniref:Uncharacterized protein n=1 Tax=Dictyobacter arantiisoli TaxID=2014874 RepID=A0A5A5TIU2_9CHLR|nr:hypothetical protein [Dictyobacter arantiisoli]GCF10909.1 hypothetical protein KDI_44730 [Dictyobacter arantiisoli]
MEKNRTTNKKTRPAPRRQRRDAGSRRSTTRDIDILHLGAEQTFVRFDTVGEWLAPDYSPATDLPPPAQLEDSTPPAKRAWPQDLRHRLMAVSRLMRKLESQGYVEIIQPWANQPAWFRVTTRGLRSLNLDWEEIPFPEAEDVEARLRHDRYYTSHNHMVNEVRLLLARGGAGAPLHTWRGERAIEEILPLREYGTRRPHKADGILYLQEDGSWDLRASNGTVLQTITMQAQQIIGIEVECTQKSNKRLLEILPDLLEHHDFVWYFCLNNSIRQAVSVARRDAFTNDEQRQRIRILKLEEYLPCP